MQAAVAAQLEDDGQDAGLERKDWWAGAPRRWVAVGQWWLRQKRCEGAVGLAERQTLPCMTLAPVV